MSYYCKKERRNSVQVANLFKTSFAKKVSRAKKMFSKNLLRENFIVLHSHFSMECKITNRWTSGINCDATQNSAEACQKKETKAT